MKEYIDKSVLVAEIERRIKRFREEKDSVSIVKTNTYKGILSFLDTLEVKEVDLEEKIQDHIKECLDVKFPTTNIELIKKDVAYTAKKFFELGMAVNNKA